MTSREDIQKGIENIIATVLDNDDFVLDESAAIIDIEEWDSLAHITIISEIEKTFKIKFKLQEFYQINNLKALIDFTEEKVV
ncbi:MAG: acyl carrier protein [Bacteroidales bacterium]|jgi:acyl carrier protein|nr:acyl carrier protein [Bacteroidales bacterium]